ncbi:hypothetical protein [Clostridium thailandense]|uniref:hypothetical protein n=1 Tax=Clostridium thailandense TaxID=2794346 RepID=UPI00398A416B
MNIDKAIRKQKKSYKRFLLSMCFIFFILPLALFLSKAFDVFYIIYLIIIEMLIFIAIFIRSDKEALKFKNDWFRLKIFLGINKKPIIINCEKIMLVHTEDIVSREGDKNEFKIILLSTSKFRSERMIEVNLKFLKNHTYVAHHYNRLKILMPEEQFYFTVIKRGGLRKYPLLDVIYKSCTHACFTEECIEKIKFYRENSQYYTDKKI